MEDDVEPEDFELSVTPQLTSAFLESLRSRKITLKFFSGSWEDFIHRGELTKYDLILTSETIYRTSSLPSLVGLLKSRSRVTIQEGEKSGGMPGELPLPGKTLCLVAAKVVYFGVGGGAGEFVTAVEASNGQVHSVWEVPSGVARRIMSIDWVK